ncbi:MAG: CHAT domain-containing protein [Coleofasciculus sp. C2-GNP5-27]
MKIAIFEVCRSPEIKKKTESLILSHFFTKQAIDYKLYSNDGIWQEKTILDKDSLRLYLKKPDFNIVHLAMHGTNDGLILQWSNVKNIGERVPEVILTDFDISLMREWQGKVVVSGVCRSAQLADSFLAAGAAAVIAPQSPIPWTNLGLFFSFFYKKIFSGKSLILALDLAIWQFPEYESYSVVR